MRGALDAAPGRRAIAYLGGLAGIEFVHEVVARAGARRYVEALWDEAEATLTAPPGLDLAVYRHDLMARFANQGLQHRTRQIAMDGSQKLPQRVLAPIVTRLEKGQGFDALALAVAAWIRWQAGRTDAGNPYIVDDPLADDISKRLGGLAEPEAMVRALAAMAEIFPARLRDNERFVETVARQLRLLTKAGAAAII